MEEAGGWEMEAGRWSNFRFTFSELYLIGSNHEVFAFDELRYQ